MAFSSFSWPFRRRGSGGGGGDGDGPSQPYAAAGDGDEELGVTPQLLDFLRTLSPGTFKSSALQLQGSAHTLSPIPISISTLPSLIRLHRDVVVRCFLAGGGSAGVEAGELTGWQERHAVLVLSQAKELAKIRYDLCPRHMKDKQFWRIYFLLAKSYTSPYELRAIQKEKVRRMETENGKAKDVTTVEVEMQESKCRRDSKTSPSDEESQDS
uniref:BSD domain-containing protein n=1 Tax=Oryza brachyantha TaxID=4533 RepID=J3M2B5_ORYBR